MHVLARCTALRTHPLPQQPGHQFASCGRCCRRHFLSTFPRNVHSHHDVEQARLNAYRLGVLDGAILSPFFRPNVLTYPRHGRNLRTKDRHVLHSLPAGAAEVVGPSRHNRQQDVYIVPGTCMQNAALQLPTLPASKKLKKWPNSLLFKRHSFTILSTTKKAAQRLTN